MSSVAIVNPLPKQVNSISQNVRNINFKQSSRNEYAQPREYADQYISQEELAMQRAIAQQQQQQKKQKRKNGFMTALAVLASIVTIGYFGRYLAKDISKDITNKASQAAKKSGAAADEVTKLFKRIDTTNSAGLDDLSYDKKTRDALDLFMERVKKADIIKKKGGSGKGTTVLLYGPPGTGKNTATEAFTKQFKDAKLYDLDISGLNSKYHGETEHNILDSVAAIVNEAKANPDKKIFVFIDEIDSVMMQDAGSNAKLSNDVLNAFKKGFNQLTNEQNIVTVGATNLKLDAELAKKEGKVLDQAMLSRFSDKILIDRPNKEQILKAITKHYSNNPEYTMIEKELTNDKNTKLIKIADFLANDKRETSFRTLNSLYENAAVISKETENCTISDLAKAIEAKKDELHLTESEVKSFLSSLGIK